MTLRLNGSSSGYTEIDAPAAAGSNTLTLPTGNGSAGQVLSTNGSGVLSFVNAITEVDQWYLTADKTSDGTLTSLSRNDHEGATHIGTGMSVSSGVFTFPITGKWMVIATALFHLDDADNVSVAVEVTLDNSSYNPVNYVADGNNGTGTRNGQGVALYFLDVTDTSQVKVRFVAGSIAGSSAVAGASTHIETSFTFIRLGDT